MNTNVPAACSRQKPLAFYITNSGLSVFFRRGAFKAEKKKAQISQWLLRGRWSAWMDLAMKGMIGGSTTASKRVASHFHIYWILEPSKNLDQQDKSKIIDHLTGHNFMNRSISNVFKS